MKLNSIETSTTCPPKKKAKLKEIMTTSVPDGKVKEAAEKVRDKFKQIFTSFTACHNIQCGYEAAKRRDGHFG